MERNPFRIHTSALDTPPFIPTPTTVNGIDACPAEQKRVLEPKAAADAPLAHRTAGVLESQAGGEEAGFSLLNAVHLVLTTGPLAGIFDSCASSGSLPSPAPDNGVKGEACLDPAATGGHTNSLVGTTAETAAASDNAAGVEAEQRRDAHDGGTAGIPKVVAGSKPAWNDTTGCSGKWPLPVAFSKVREMLEEVCSTAERLNFRRVDKEALERYLEAVNAGVEVAGQRMPLVPAASENLCPR